jgi:protein-S-isoprenylcysteine O-methyltransferase Ste14
LSLANALVLAAVYLAQIRRMRDEERLLSADPGYQTLLAHTRYRLIPFVY